MAMRLTRKKAKTLGGKIVSKFYSTGQLGGNEFTPKMPTMSTDRQNPTTPLPTNPYPTSAFLQ